MGEAVSAYGGGINATKNKRTDKIWRFMIDVRCKAWRTASAIQMEPVRPRAGDLATARGRAVSNGTLGQPAINSPGQGMLVGEPQKYKADNRHYYVNWKNQSHVTGEKLCATII